MTYNHEQCDITCNELHAVSTGIRRDCNDCDGYGEGFYSSLPCDTCNSLLGGIRYPAHYLDDNNELCHMDICKNCSQYITYGELPDDTA